MGTPKLFEFAGQYDVTLDVMCDCNDHIMLKHALPPRFPQSFAILVMGSSDYLSIKKSIENIEP